MSTEFGGIDSFIPKSQAETFARHLQNRLRSLSTGSEGDGIEDTSWNGDQLSSSSENDIYYDLDSCPGSPAEDALETDFADYINIKHDEKEEHSIYPSLGNNNHTNCQRVSAGGNGDSDESSSTNGRLAESSRNENTPGCYCFERNHHKLLKYGQPDFHNKPSPNDILNAEEASSSLLQTEPPKNHHATNHCHCFSNGFKGQPAQYTIHDETAMYLHLNKVSSIDKFTPFDDSEINGHDNNLSVNSFTDGSNVRMSDLKSSYENSPPIDIERKLNGLESSPSHHPYSSQLPSASKEYAGAATPDNHFACQKCTSSSSTFCALHHNSVDSAQGFFEQHLTLDNRNGTDKCKTGQESLLLATSENNSKSSALNAIDNVSNDARLESFFGCRKRQTSPPSAKTLSKEENDLPPYPEDALSRLVDSVFSNENSLDNSVEDDTCGLDKSEGETKEENVEEESIEVRRSRFRRSSSLKTGKTPPGTPGQKKIVRFADVLGLDLADVRTFLDEVPKIPKSAFEDLHGVELSSSPIRSGLSDFFAQAMAVNRIQKIIIPLFQQPSSRSDFIDRVRGCFVCLENAIVSDMVLFAITGVVRVKNIDFHKSVHIRYSIDSWKSFADLQTKYVPNSCDGLSDKFSFLLYAHMLNVGQRLEFAVRFQTREGQFWDNNKGANYVFLCIPDGPTKNEMSSYIPPSPAETWASFY